MFSLFTYFVIELVHYVSIRIQTLQIQTSVLFFNTREFVSEHKRPTRDNLKLDPLAVIPFFL